MRVPIRVQLALLVLLTVLAALAVICIAIWVNNYHFVIGVESLGLTLTASLKAAQIASDLQLLQSTCGTIVTRILIQQALQRFNNGDDTDANWVNSVADVQAALGSGGYATLFQAIIFPKKDAGNTHGLLNVTSSVAAPVTLPYTHPNGTVVMLGDQGLGYPSSLYPNLTFVPTAQADPADKTKNLTAVYAFPDFQLNATSHLLLGPLQVNSSFAIFSLTLPIINNTFSDDVLAYITVVADASRLSDVLSSREGLGDSGVALLLGAARAQNRFSPDVRSMITTSFSDNTTILGAARVDFVFPPATVSGQADRHDVYSQSYRSSFPLSSYPAALTVLSHPSSAINNASSDLSTTNEQGSSVAVGVARPPSTLVDWVVIVEQSHDEAWTAVVELRNILVACVFGTAGLVALLVVPLAHFSVLPIRRLKDATEKSVQPPGYSEAGSIRSQSSNEPAYIPESSERRSARSRGVFTRIFGRRSRRGTHIERAENARRRVFKVPGKVQEKKHFVTDELTELTSTFNEMSDELMMQYAKLEERVAQRTRELEISKKAAEAANESKTLFIANISHELKTPLNGILGMCAVCMGENDLGRIKKSLEVIYKSGDLLLHLLNDLLSFSKNQIGQALSLDEKEFGLSEIKSQVTSIFDKQVREGRIDFSVNFVGTENEELNRGRSSEKYPEKSSEKPPNNNSTASGPPGTGRLKDMRLWGDQHRIQQVIINLVNNSLKFTPEGGRVELRITCVGQADEDPERRRENSVTSKQGSQRRSGVYSAVSRAPSNSGASFKPGDTALTINPMERTILLRSMQVQERSPTPPPTNAMTLIFDFEVIDTGPGIPENLQQRIFEPFVQGDLGLSKKYGGTGLGLSICSQLSTLMGGTITLDSTEGVGTTFKMRIPLKYVKEVASSMTSSIVSASHPPSILSPDESRGATRIPGDSGMANMSPGNNATRSFPEDPQPRLVGLSQPFFASVAPLPSGKGFNSPGQASDHVSTSTQDRIRVLVAEDNQVNQEVVLRMLKLEDIYNVTVAKDGQEAYDIVKASFDEGKAYDLIFMDIQMPNVDGLQSTRLIRDLGYSAPIVALSAFSEESNIKACMDSGMNMFLSKPIRRPALKQVLKKFGTIPEGVET